MVKFINAGYDAVKAASPSTKVIIHIDRAHDDGLDKGFFSGLKTNGGKWDVSGTDASGGTFSDIQYTVNDLAASFNTPGAGDGGVMMCEIEPPNEYGSNNNAFNPVPNFDFVTNFLTIMRAIPNGKGAGVIYWEAEADPTGAATCNLPSPTTNPRRCWTRFARRSCKRAARTSSEATASPCNSREPTWAGGC